MNILHAVLYTIVLTRKNYLNNEELFRLVIIYFIQVTLMFDSGIIKCGDIGIIVALRCYRVKCPNLIHVDTLP